MYRHKNLSTAVDISDDFKFQSEHFLFNPADQEFIENIMLPEGLIKSRCEALALEII